VKGIVAYIAVVLLVIFVLAPSTPAQSPVDAAKKQIQTAIFHAGELAQRGTALASVQVHVAHTINCLEGTKGKNFNAAPGHVCQGQGNGIIPDLQAAQVAGVRGADNALKFANVALTLALQARQMTSVDEAQPWAKVIAGQLKQALDSLP
jgi:hypothetical protein